jgi:hypothetical protein
MPEIMMYESGSGNKLYIPAIVRQIPSTYSMANISPAYVTETDAMPSSARKIKYSINDCLKYNARPGKRRNREKMIEVRMVKFTMSLLRFFFLGDVWG